MYRQITDIIDDMRKKATEFEHYVQLLIIILLVFGAATTLVTNRQKLPGVLLSFEFLQLILGLGAVHLASRIIIWVVSVSSTFGDSIEQSLNENK